MSNAKDFGKVSQEIERLKRQADSLSLDIGREIVDAHIMVLVSELGEEHKPLFNRVLKSLAQKIRRQTTNLDRL